MSKLRWLIIFPVILALFLHCVGVAIGFITNSLVVGFHRGCEIWREWDDKIGLS